jgi:hypothetical protein
VDLMTAPRNARLEAARARVERGERTGAQRITPDERAPVAQWVGMFLAAATFAVHLEVSYNLVPWECARGGELMIHLVDVAAVLLSLAGTIVAWRVWRRAGRDEPAEGGGSVLRTSFLGVCGLGFSAIVTLVLFAQWVAAFFISPCQ